MAKASRYEREFLHILSRDNYIIGRFAASGTINTVVGDLVVIPRKSSGDPRPILVEVKYTTKKVYYPSANVHLLYRLSQVFNYRPFLAVRFKGAGWVIVDLERGVPKKVTPENAQFYKVSSLRL